MEELITSLKEKVEEGIKLNEKIVEESKTSSEKFESQLKTLETAKEALITKLDQ